MPAVQEPLTNDDMELQSVAISPVNLIDGAFVIAVVAHPHPRKIAERSRRLRMLLAPRTGADGGNGLNGRNEEDFFSPFRAIFPLMRVFFAPFFRLGPLVGLGVRLNAPRINKISVSAIWNTRNEFCVALHPVRPHSLCWVFGVPMNGSWMFFFAPLLGAACEMVLAY